MSSTRLAQHHRERILQAAISNAFDRREKLLQKEKSKLFPRLRAAIFGAAALRRMDRLPNGWLPPRDVIRVEVGDSTYSFSDGHPFKVPADTKFSSKLHALPPELQQCVQAYATAWRELEDEKDSTRRNLRASLKTFSTLEVLLKQWPELEPFTKGIEQAAGNLPACTREHINKALGIAA